MEYKYGMRLRGFSIGCQPMDGFVRREDDLTGVYHDIIVYDRPLNEKECEQYELDDLNPQETKVMIEDLLIEFDEMGFCPTTLCPDPEKYAIEWREKVRAEFERLEAENAELKARLDKAVELKANVGDIVYMPWKYDGTFDIARLLITGIYFKKNEFHYITNLESDSAYYLEKYKHGIFRDKDFNRIVFTNRTEAEARLAELKGENR